ncbi:unnamed protein product [Phyllotreta striolata]|uniref:FAS1 domain-containing protein n=1 Tax=Phyllotreta striolata TaxID=444603 RepID=A0A9N9TJ56_PHYSR|nr:unnamed protein product [Phyllotreta striolata]
MGLPRAGIGIAIPFLLTYATNAAILLPNTSGIDGQLTANHKVDHFFSLWLVFNNDNVKTSDEPFTVFAPQNSATRRAENLLHQPDLIKKLLLDHVVLGSLVDLTNASNGTSVKTLGGGTVDIRPAKENNLKANNVNVVERKVVVPNGILVILDDYLFPLGEEMKQDNAVSTSSSTVAPAKEKPAEAASFSAGPSESSKNQSNTTFVENIMEVLSFLKGGVRVFQHFLSRSNVSNLLRQDEEYTVFVPTDHAFQRWHPIDWGFYPFSVPEFTESVIVNHFVKGRLRQHLIKDGEIVKTLGGKEIVFRKTPSLTVNGAMLVKGDTPVARGNIMFIGEVLFVTESIVSKLHQQHKDKETPPLLAFPWFGAQFLSHAFLALERDRRFSHITRFLNLADLAPHVSGTGYTFFVPTDTAFEKLGLNRMPDNYLSNNDGLRILLNHFVKGRLYDKDLTDGLRLESLGNRTIAVKRTDKGEVYINDAKIVESEVFVYNLGTMFYIDTVLFTTDSAFSSTTAAQTEPSTSTEGWTTEKNVEKVPDELVEETGSLPDVLFADGISNDNETESVANTTQINTIK